MFTDTLSITDTELETLLGDAMDMYIVFGPLKGKVVETTPDGGATFFKSEAIKCTGEPLVGPMYVVTASGERLNWNLTVDKYTNGATWAGDSVVVTIRLVWT